MAAVGASWIKPGAMVRDTRSTGRRGMVIAIFAGNPWVAWEDLQPGPGLHFAGRCRWEHLRQDMVLAPVKGKENGK